jgi:hypothetical protein
MERSAMNFAWAWPPFPSIHCSLVGYHHVRGNEGVLDDIFGKATVLDDRQTRPALSVHRIKEF